MMASAVWKTREVIRWGIIGCGEVTEIKSGPGFQKANGSRLVAVMRRNAALAEDYARRHGVPKWCADADGLIRDPGVDAVYVATPPGTHCEYALKICAAGKPAYVEKPMARNATECQRMVDAFAAAGLPLFVAYYRRALDRFLKVKELVDAGAFGRLTGVRCHFAGSGPQPMPAGVLPWRLRAAESGGGLFFDLGSHALDILDFMLGPLVEVTGVAVNRASPGEVEDSVAMSFRTESDVPGVATWDFAGAVREDVIQITGVKGRVSLSTFGTEPVRWESGEGVQEFDLPHPPHVAQPLIQAIVDELRGHGRCASTGASALRTARVMDRVTESYYGGRNDEFWLRPESWPGRHR